MKKQHRTSGSVLSDTLGTETLSVGGEVTGAAHRNLAGVLSQIGEGFNGGVMELGNWLQTELNYYVNSKIRHFSWKAYCKKVGELTCSCH